MEPTLPEDLEREIFKLAAGLHFPSIPALMRVAWRVNAWVEPLLYQALFVRLNAYISSGHTPDAFAQDVATRPEFFRDAIRHLHITMDVGLFGDQLPAGFLLATCTRLETLALQGGSFSLTAELLPLIKQLHSLTRLHADFGALFGGLEWGERSVPFGTHAFSRLTHIEMLDETPSQQICAGLARLPSLTHLALKYEPRIRGILCICTQVLQGCPALRVLGALQEKHGFAGSTHPEPYCAFDTPKILEKDLRFVLVTYARRYEPPKEWLNDVRSGRLPGFWECAEKAVARRMAARSRSSER
ncbi:hypothetical protein B0H19DRAFT_1341706 [Mycena capillaripes]|nr:hypothetical protein B0H19DRAFT_1341706 [Mycena capillaripes]